MGRWWARRPLPTKDVTQATKLLTFHPMTDATLHDLHAPAERTRPAPEPKPDWPLIGDILTSRLDRPDLLRLWPEGPR